MDCYVSWFFRYFAWVGADYRPSVGCEEYGVYPPSDLPGFVFGDGHWCIFVGARAFVLGTDIAFPQFGTGRV